MLVNIRNTDSYKTISAETGKETGILVENWGQASAVHIHGKKHNLPEPISFDGWFYRNTIDNHTFKTDYIVYGMDSSSLSQIFSGIVRLNRFKHPYCMPHESNKLIYHCSNPIVDLKSYWFVAKSPDKEFTRILQGESIKSAKEYYYKQKAIHSDTLLFTEKQVNKMGYDFMNIGDLDKALEIFIFNVEMFPESFNVYDSYAEALMNKGVLDSAIVNYNKSLELNPNNTNAVKMLDEIRSRNK